MSDAGRVPTGLALKTRLVMNSRWLWLKLSQLESQVMADELAPIQIQQPVFVTGLARSGTTIVTEMLAEHPHFTSHHYADFPFLFTPYWRNWLASRAQISQPKRTPRAHQDRIQVSLLSPEAFEEVLWMAFDRQLHHQLPAQTVGPGQAPANFADYYTDHLRKLLLVRDRPRYLAKGNYNLLRIPWLVNQFPDARIVVMVRHPVWHVASLLKQHRLFCAAQVSDSRTAGQLAASGHFEFGPQRRAAAFAGMDGSKAVESLWASGDEIRGWARLWAQAYGLLLELQRSQIVAGNLCAIRYEDLCWTTDMTLTQLKDHCALGPEFAPVAERYRTNLTAPDYYAPQFSARDLATIGEETDTVAQQLGYAEDSS